MPTAPTIILKAWQRCMAAKRPHFVRRLSSAPSQRLPAASVRCFSPKLWSKRSQAKGSCRTKYQCHLTFYSPSLPGAATTVFVTALVGLPISTTHALIGALTGAGLIAAGAQVNFSMLGAKFVLPLLLSPLACILITMPVYRLGQMVSARLGLKKESYLHISPGKLVPTRGLAFETGTAGYWSGEKTPKGFISIEGKTLREKNTTVIFLALRYNA